MVAAFSVQLRKQVVIMRLLLYDGLVFLAKVGCHGVDLICLWLAVAGAVIHVPGARLLKGVVFVLVHVVVLCYLCLAWCDLVLGMLVYKRFVVVQISWRLFGLVFRRGSLVVFDGRIIVHVDLHFLGLETLINC